MMKRNKFGLLVLVTVLCFAMMFATGCSKDNDATGNGDNDNINSTGTLASVDASGIQISETATAVLISWRSVPNAKSYELRVGEWSCTTVATTYNLRIANGPTLPDSGEITIAIVAKAEGYTDSTPTTKTYTTEGIQLGKPAITSAENGIIVWTAVPGAKAYTVSVDGAVVVPSQTTTSYDASAYTSNVEIRITAVGDGVWLKNSESATAIYSPGGVISPTPVSEFVVDGEVLRWGETEGVTEYRVADIDFNVVTISGTSYDMSNRNLVYGVYPVTDSGIGGSEILPTEIKYLDGEGTAQSPYLIKTPFDLRAIDYYETVRAETGGDKIYYRLENDIDYNQVNALDEESNIYTLRKPFFGVLDGNGKKLANIKVKYDGGYWSLFDLIAAGGTVKDLIIDNPEITNVLQDAGHPLNAAIAAVAHFNYGTVSGITLSDAQFSAQAGVVSGIVSRNYGTVSGCRVSGEFTQSNTSTSGSAKYEMAGVVLENLSGGIVSDNIVSRLTLRGTNGNISSAAGVVSINRAGGTVSGNSFTTVAISGMAASGMGAEYGGVVAYNAGTVVKGAGSLGTLTVGGSSVSAEIGSTSARGTLIGKNDGTVR